MKAFYRLILPCVGGLGLLASGCGDNDTCGEGFAQEGGVCVPSAQCGPGTVLDTATRECVPDGSVVCDQGTIFNPDTGTCLIDPDSCAAGTVFLGGECIPEDEALEGMADHLEMPEPNDGFGGIAGSFPAPAEGASTTLFGCIEPAGDANGDGNLDADEDAWVVTTTGPTLLDVVADGIRGLSAGYVFVNGDPANSPALDAWQRFGVNLTGDTSARQVYLPLAGTYVLIMADSRALFLDSAGAEGACYFTTVSTVPMPAATALTVPQTTFTQKSDVRVFSYNADVEADILVSFLDSPSGQVAPGMIIERAGDFFAVSDGNGALFSLGNLQVAGDEVTIIVDPVFNYALVPQAHVIDAIDIPAFALPTDGSTLTVTKRIPAGGATFDTVDYLYFDVADGGAVVHFDMVSEDVAGGALLPVVWTVFRSNVFDTPSGQGLVQAPIADFFGAIDTFSGEHIRFLEAGRYYMQSFDPGGVAGDTYDITSTLTPIVPTEITYNDTLAAQTLPATGSGFHFVDLNQPIWLEANVAGGELDGAAAIVLYDLAGEGILFADYTPFLAEGIPDDGTGPVGQITRGLDLNALVEVFSLGAPAVDPSYDVSIGDRAFVDLGALDEANPIDRDDDATVGGEPIRYFFTGTTADRVTTVLTPAAGADGVLRQLNRNESSRIFTDVNGAGGVETQSRSLVQANPEDFMAFEISTDVDSTVDLSFTAAPPQPFDIDAASGLTYADVCGNAGAIQIFGGFNDETLAAQRTLPFTITYFGDPITLNYRVSSNGWLALGPAGTSARFGADPIPASGVPNGVVAPMWADLDFVAGCIFNEANQVTIQWTGELFLNAAETAEMQVVIHDTGVIDFIYGDNHVLAGDEPFSSTVGVEDIFGLFGHEIYRNAAGINPGDSYTLTPQ